MSMQARMSQSDPRLYSPARDVAHNFKDVVVAAFERLANGTWEATNGVPPAELVKACEAFVLFASAGMKGKNDMEQALRASGWFDVTPRAQVA